MARGLKQKEAAAILEVGPSMISRWEKGDCMPDLINVLKMSLLYRTVTDALFIDHMRELRVEIMQKEELVLMKKI